MYFETPEPAPGQEKWDWPTIRIPFSFDPPGGWGGNMIVKVDHGGRGGWIHALIWWVRRNGVWTANNPVHDPQAHPVGASRGHAGSERFVGYGWQSAPPAGADLLEIVTSAPDGVIVDRFYEK